MLASRWSGHCHFIPCADSECDDAALLDVLRPLGAARPVLLCTTDWSIEAVARHSRILAEAGFRFLIPSHDTVQRLNDKVQETRLIASLGFALPKSVYPVPRDPLEVERTLGPEVIFKPRSFREAKMLKRKNLVARNRCELAEIYAKFGELLPLLIGQEIIPGGDESGWVASATFDASSKLLACATKRKVRMVPPHFGATSIAVSQWNRELADLTRDLGARIGHVGQANFEFSYDARDGRYKYIEMNPRIPATVIFDEVAGVQTVWNTYLAAIGHPPDLLRAPQRDGVIFLDLAGDLTARWRDGESLGSVVRHHIGLLCRPHCGAYFAWDDPLPGVWRLARFGQQAFSGVVRKIRKRFRRHSM